MKKLCFGSLMTVLLRCKASSTTQKSLCGTMLLSVNPDYDIRTDDGTTSALVKGTANVSKVVIDAARTSDNELVISFFKSDVIPLLDSNKKSNVVLALKEIISEDTDIKNDTVIELIGNTKKIDVITSRELNFEEFIAGIFLYTLYYTDNRFPASIKEVTKDFISTFDARKGEITFDIPSFPSLPCISKTIKGKSFDNIFTEVRHTASLKLRNPNCLKIFQLDVANNEFDFSALKDFLLNNIGRYVFSRAQMEQFRLDDELETIGLKAVRMMHDGCSNTGEELGEILLYSFLEQVLNAPKIMSKVELDRTSSKSSKSDGVHILSIPGTPTPYYQLIFGTSDIVGSINDAIDAAFTSINEIGTSAKSEMQLIDSSSLGILFDKKTAEQMKQILVPSKGRASAPDTAFGIFLGYSINLEKNKYSNTEYRAAVVKKMAEDIQASADYIATKIADCGLSAYSFYFYVLPFDDAITDKKSIMEDLLTGGNAE